MKLIYIIITHGVPTLVLRIINRLDSPESRFIIHVDKNTKEDIFSQYKQALNHRSNVIFMPRISVYWGDFSIIQVEFNAMALIQKMGFDYDYAILLSGAHYPIKTKEVINEFFSKNKGSLFIKSYELPTGPDHAWANEEGGLARILYWHIIRFPKIEKLIFWWIRPILRAVRLDWLLKRKYEFNLKLYGGSQWWCLDKIAIDYIMDFLDKNKKFISFFKFSKVPDEMLVQTILLNSLHKNRIINNNLMFIKWPEKVRVNSPCILTWEDIVSLTQSDRLFARKFDYQADPGLFDEIDRVIQISKTERPKQ